MLQFLVQGSLSQERLLLLQGLEQASLLKQDTFFFSEKLLVYNKLIHPIAFICFLKQNITSRKQTLLAFS